MALAVNPVLPVIASKEADSVAPDLTLEAGSVVNAQVLKVLSADLVRIAIAAPEGADQKYCVAVGCEAQVD